VAVAERTERLTGVPTGPDEVVITSGGQAALFAAHHLAATRATGAPRGPFSPTYPGTIRATGAVPVAVRARAEDGFQPRETDLEAAAGGRPIHPRQLANNPTGVVYDEATLRGIGQVAERHDLWIVSDEVYDSQVWEGRHLSPRALPGLARRTLVVGLTVQEPRHDREPPGLDRGSARGRGAAVGPRHLHELRHPGLHPGHGRGGPGAGPGLRGAVAEPFRRRRDIIARLLGTQDAVRAAPLAGAMYAMLDVRATGMTGEAFAHRLLDEERVAVMPGESFGEAGAGHVRVAMTVEDGAFEDALGRLLALARRLAATRA
jgi:arginine:pyruvate transaminase